MAKARKATRKANPRKASRSGAKKTRRGKIARSKTRAARTKSRATTVKRKTARKAKQQGFVASVVDAVKETHDLREKLAGHNTFED